MAPKHDGDEEFTGMSSAAISKSAEFVTSAATGNPAVGRLVGTASKGLYDALPESSKEIIGACAALGAVGVVKAGIITGVGVAALVGIPVGVVFGAVLGVGAAVVAAVLDE